MTDDINLAKSLAELDSLLKDLQPQEESEEAEAPDGYDENGNPFYFAIKNGAYVRVDDYNMRAFLYLNPPKNGEDFYSKDDIYEFLAQNKITYGFHKSNIAAIAKKHISGREILVAKGSLPKPGLNGFYEFFFETVDRRKPLIREDGTVDYTSMSQITNVNKGDKIAVYHHATPGEDGYDVYGKKTSVKPTKELPLLKGRGFEHNIDPDIYVANISGRIDYKNGAIDIKDVYEVRGDVDLVTGKVEFFGDITIKGNVGSGVTIRASRNVFIEGVVESAFIYAGGDITIKKGVTGNDKAVIKAKGNVYSDFIEYANVEANQNVRANYIMNSNVYAAGKVIAEGKNGSILGGNVRGLLGVNAGTIGNDKSVKTTVASGFSAAEYESYVQCHTKENELKDNLSNTVEQMTQILKNKRLGNDKDSDESDKLIEILNAKKDELFESLDKVRREREELSEVIEKGKGNAIVVNNRIYEGSKICIEGSTLVIPSTTDYVRYKFEDGRIVVGGLIR